MDSTTRRKHPGSGTDKKSVASMPLHCATSQQRYLRNTEIDE